MSLLNKSHDSRSRDRTPAQGLTLDKFLQLTDKFPDDTAIKLDLPWDKIYFQHVAKISIRPEGLLMDSGSQLQSFLRLADFRRLNDQCAQKVLRHQRLTISMVDIDKRSGSIVLG